MTWPQAIGNPHPKAALYARIFAEYLGENQ